MPNLMKYFGTHFNGYGVLIISVHISVFFLWERIYIINKINYFKFSDH